MDALNGKWTKLMKREIPENIWNDEINEALQRKIVYKSPNVWQFIYAFIYELTNIVAFNATLRTQSEADENPVR